MQAEHCAGMMAVFVYYASFLVSHMATSTALMPPASLPAMTLSSISEDVANASEEMKKYM